MSTRTTTLALEVVSDVDDAVSGLGRVDTAAQSAATGIDKLSAANDVVGGKLDATAAAADGLDSKAAAATGAMGALSSGFELLGAEGAAKALQDAALATDFLSGVGQTAALATQGQAAATKVLTGAQKALNVVMRANPLGLLIVAGLAAAALFTVLYAKSETFRAIVQKAGAAGKAAMDAVVNGATAVVGWVKDRIPAAFRWFQDKAGAVVKPATNALEGARDAAKSVFEWVRDIPAKFGALKDKATEIAAPLLAPFTAVENALDRIVDFIANFKVPDWFGKLGNPLGRATTTGAGMGYDTQDPGLGGLTLGRNASTTDTRPNLHLTINGALDPYAVAAQFQAIATRYNLAVS